MTDQTTFPHPRPGYAEDVPIHAAIDALAAIGQNPDRPMTETDKMALGAVAAFAHAWVDLTARQTRALERIADGLDKLTQPAIVQAINEDVLEAFRR